MKFFIVSCLLIVAVCVVSASDITGEREQKWWAKHLRTSHSHLLRIWIRDWDWCDPKKFFLFSSLYRCKWRAFGLRNSVRAFLRHSPSRCKVSYQLDKSYSICKSDFNFIFEMLYLPNIIFSSAPSSVWCTSASARRDSSVDLLDAFSTRIALKTKWLSDHGSFQKHDQSIQP